MPVQQGPTASPPSRVHTKKRGINGGYNGPFGGVRTSIVSAPHGAGGEIRGVKHLIVNADDFGCTRGVNSAIAEAHRSGIVTSTSMLANGTTFEDAVGQAPKNPLWDAAMPAAGK